MRRKNPLCCAEVQSALRADWADGFYRTARAEELNTASLDVPRREEETLHRDGCGALEAHLLTCTDCRNEADEIRRLDKSLAQAICRLERLVAAPSEERIVETLRRLRDEPLELEILRKIRRPLRIILWGTFYLFTLLAASVLAAALYKALKGM